jgi:ATP/maltotriose-dependent transcriptional regulator MalT
VFGSTPSARASTTPGAFPVAPDLVEALIELDQRPEAVAVADRLAELSEQQGHPWGLTSAKRCRAVIGLQRAYDPDAAALLPEAADDYAGLGLRFDLLAAAGASNKEIAKRLSISVPTVERHLSHIYGKLGLTSRAQLAHVWRG